jgi:hypothetical protein
MLCSILDHLAIHFIVPARARSPVLAGAVMIAVAAAQGCGLDPDPAEPETGIATGAVLQTCRATNVQGAPYSGIVCGGSVIDGCSKGVLYSCQRATGNNCTLSQSCTTACLTGPNSTPVSLNTTTPSASDACFTGTAPLALSASSVQGGNNVTMTATLTQSHAPFAIVNLTGTTSQVPPLCDVPLLLASSATTVSWVEPTAPVTSTTIVPLSVLTSFNDTNGKSRALVAVPVALTLTSGGSVTVPPLASFSLTDPGGAAVTTLQGGTNAFTRGTLSVPAPVGGVNVTVTSNPTTAFVTNGSFQIHTGCTSTSDAGLLTATSAATSNLAAAVTATTGVGTPITRNVTITPPALAIQSVALTPSTVRGGTSSSATVTLNRNVLASDASSTVTVRLSEGLITGTPHATFPGCTGSPACTGPLTVPVGAASASLTISTLAVAAEDQITLAASAVWSNTSASRNLAITP